MVSLISVLGTALSIAMILVIVLVFQINNSGYAPESLRSRMLYVDGINAKAENSQNNSSISAEVIKACFYSLKTPMAVTAMYKGWETRPVSLPSKRLFREYAISYTDHAFWEIFDFTFLYGKPFTQADFESAIPRVVITSEVAARLLGKVDAVGQTVIIDDSPYTVAGVVKPVSKAARTAYAEIWAPYSTNAVVMSRFPYCGGCGYLQAVMLAHSSGDFEQINDELNRQLEQYNAGQSGVVYRFPSGALTHLETVTGSNSWHKKPVSDYFLQTGLLLLFLLLVPALNLTGVIQSSVRKRRGEIGIRKSFGATSGILVRQILYENLLTTLIGGICGLVLALALLPVCKSFMLYDSTMQITFDMLFKPGLFAAATVFVLVLNLLSAGIPAVLISRQNIVDAINDSE